MTIVVDDCCGIIKLRSGCLLMGYFSLMCTLCFFFACVFGIVQGDNLTQSSNTSARYGTIWIVGISLIITYSILLVPTILELLFTILLLVGVHKKKPALVQAHLILNMIFLVLYIITFTAYIGGGYLTFKKLIKDAISLSMALFFLLIERSYYLELANAVKRETESESF